jgi:hypothetical protein
MSPRCEVVQKNLPQIVCFQVTLLDSEQKQMKAGGHRLTLIFSRNFNIDLCVIHVDEVHLITVIYGSKSIGIFQNVPNYFV